MIALFDIGNTHTHLGLADSNKVRRQASIPTASWRTGRARPLALDFFGGARVDGAALCSVVPSVTPMALQFVKSNFTVSALALDATTVRGVGIDYPQPATIGPDRLANAVAVRRLFGAPAVVVDFGTAVTFDVVNGRGDYVGGIIAPGLDVMTDYLHEKTALLPRIRIRNVAAIVGKNTEQAMLIGAVHGYRGLVRELIAQLKKTLRVRRLPVVATGGYAKLISARMPEITAVAPALTLEGLRLVWRAHAAESRGGDRPCHLADEHFNA